MMMIMMTQDCGFNVPFSIFPAVSIPFFWPVFILMGMGNHVSCSRGVAVGDVT